MKSSLDSKPPSKLQEKTSELSDKLSKLGFNWIIIFLIILATSTISTVMFFAGRGNINRFRVDYPSPEDVTAPQDMKIQDVASSRKMLEKAKHTTPAYFTYTNSYNEDLLKDLTRALRLSPSSTRKFFETTFPEVATKINNRNLIKLARWLAYTLKKTSRSYIIEGKIPETKAGAIILKGEKELKTELKNLIPIEEFVKRACEESYLCRNSPSREFFLEVAQKIIAPNTFFNEVKTNREVMKKIENRYPVFYRVKEGEVVVRKGDIITQEKLTKIRAILRERAKERTISWYIFLILFISGINFILLFLMSIQMHLSVSIKDALFFSTLMLTQVALMRIFYSSPGSIYLTPFFHVPLVVFSLIRKTHLSIPAVLGIGILPLCFGLTEGPLLAGVWIGAGLTLTAILTKRQIQRRLDFIAFALVGSVTSIPFSFILSELSGYHNISFETTFYFAVSGVLSGVLAIGVLPAIERIFRYTTNVYLLELASLNHPLLKELAVKAPGTYNHSIMVGTLAEAAAEAIGANPILVRVAAYFHDVGKMQFPQYFIENQKEGEENPHNRFTPNMSAKIIISHIKFGQEFARRYHLPDEIVDVIREHQGQSLVRFFYEKAKEKAEDPSLVREEDYRYPGPKPRSKESAIIMLADAVEAAARTLRNATEDEIKGMVQKIVNRIFRDGQLENAPITLRDMNLIAEAFIKVLTGIYHRRIDYPLPVSKREERTVEEKRRNGTAKKEAGEEDQEEIKRLGIQKY